MINTGKIKGISFKAIVFILSILSILTFVLGTGCNDMKVFLGAARQVDDGQGILYDGFNLWDIKGAFFRLQMYLFYKIGLTFCHFPSYEFEVVLFSSYAIVLLFFLWLCAKLVKSQNVFGVFYYLVLSFFTVGYGCRLQPEMTSCLLGLLAFAIYQHGLFGKNNKNLWFALSGIVAGGIFFYKSINILICFSILAAVYINEIINDKEVNVKRYFIVIASAISFIIMAQLFVLFFNPNDLNNTFNVSIYQKNLFSNGNIKALSERLYSLCFGIGRCFLDVPAVLFGVLFTVINIKSHKINRMSVVVAHMVMWIMPLLVIVIADKYFNYHFLVLMLPAEFEAYFARNHLAQIIKDNENGVKKLLLGISFVICISFFAQLDEKILYSDLIKYLFVVGSLVLLVSCIMLAYIFDNKRGVRIAFLSICLFLSLYYINYVSLFSHSFVAFVQSNNSVYEQNQIVADSLNHNADCLYLDDGRGAYFLKNNSYLYCTYALPLQRIHENDENKNEEYLFLYEKAMDYDGEYVCLYDNWFFGEDNNQRLRNKINDEYEKRDVLKIWTSSEWPFMKQDESQFTNYNIYKKKNIDRDR